MRKARANPEMERSENFDAAANGRNGVVVQPRRETASNLFGADLWVDVKYVSPMVQIDPLKHSLDGAFTFFVYRKGALHLASNRWR